MSAAEQQTGPYGPAEIAKDLAIMICISAVIIGFVIVLKTVIPPI